MRFHLTLRCFLQDLNGSCDRSRSLEGDKVKHEELYLTLQEVLRVLKVAPVFLEEVLMFCRLRDSVKLSPVCYRICSSGQSELRQPERLGRRQSGVLYFRVGTQPLNPSMMLPAWIQIEPPVQVTH